MRMQSFGCGSCSLAGSVTCCECASSSAQHAAPRSPKSCIHQVAVNIDQEPSCPRWTAGSKEARLHHGHTRQDSTGAFPVGRRSSNENLIPDKDTPKIGRRVLKGPSRPKALFGGIGIGVLAALYFCTCVLLAAREWRAQWAPSASGPAAGAAGGIPKVIHQMYRVGALPEKWRGVPSAWAKLHPPSEYTYMLWTDESLRALIAKEYPWLLETYDAYPFPTQRWDASRYAVLHKCAAFFVGGAPLPPRSFF